MKEAGSLWTEKEYRELQGDRASGMTLKEIGQKWGRSPHLVRLKLIKAGWRFGPLYVSQSGIPVTKRPAAR